LAKKIIRKIHEVKKELILQEASIIFEKNGYDNMKISDLAKDVGVSQSTIYSMFESKDGLYIEYIRLQIKNFLEELLELTIKSTTYEKLNKFTTLKFEYYMKKEKAIESNIKNNPLFFNTLYHDYTNPYLKDMIKISQSQINEIQNQYKYLRILAPNEGIIIKKNINSGEMAIPGVTALILSDLNNLKIKVDISERDLKHMFIGKEVALSIESINLQTKGKISAIIPSSNLITHTFTIKISIDKIKNLYPGMYTKISISL
jgi:AcrR family transcriptional regulator